MTFLALDTSANRSVIVIANEIDGACLGSSVFEGRRSLSQRLMGEIDALLASVNLNIDDIMGFAVGIGPGSFTGLRVGLVTFKTLAQVTSRPLVSMPSLDLYAWGRGPGTVVVVTPSRSGEVYAAVYHHCAVVESYLSPTRQAFAATYEEMNRVVADLAVGGIITLCGDPELVEKFVAHNVQSVELTEPPAASIGALAAAKFRSRNLDNPFALVPMYVVPPAISTPKDLSILPHHSEATE